MLDFSFYYRFKAKVGNTIKKFQIRCDKFRFGYSKHELFDYDYFFLSNELCKLKALRDVYNKWHEPNQGLDNLIEILERMISIYGTWENEEEYQQLLIELFDTYKDNFETLWI